jgi:hypothetical protein
LLDSERIKLEVTMNATIRSAALIDGTALYFKSREGRSERLDYEALNHRLQANAASAFDPALFFTTYDAQHEGQAKFLTFLQTRLRWKVEARPVWEADPLPKEAWERGDRRNEFVRFDSSIAFALGRLVGRRDRIIVVTDSFALEQPMLAATEYGQTTEIVLAFFGRQLDQRWLPIVRGRESKIKFWDLEEDSKALFGREFASNKSGPTTLAQLS